MGEEGIWGGVANNKDLSKQSYSFLNIDAQNSSNAAISVLVTVPPREKTPRQLLSKKEFNSSLGSLVHYYRGRE